MKKYLSIFILTLVIFTNCSKQNSKTELNVAIAASLFPPLQEIKKHFESQNQTKLNLIKASSGKITTQIENGAPYDVFLSANFKFAKDLYDKNLTTTPPFIFAKGRLVLWTFNQNTALPEEFSSWKTEYLNKIAIAHPVHAPCGDATVDALKHINQYDLIKDKIIIGESIAQVNHFIMNQAVDMGITSKSVVLSLPKEQRGKWIDIPEEYHSPITYSVVVIKNQNSIQENNLSEKFVSFLGSKTAQEIFRKYGFSSGEIKK